MRRKEGDCEVIAGGKIVLISAVQRVVDDRNGWSR